MRIPVTKPWFTQAERRAVAGPLSTGWVAQGPQVEAFEAAFAEMSGARHAVAVSSCTAAMHLALAALDVGPGSEVIVPSFSFVATAAAVEHTGAKPVFCDVLPNTFCIDCEDAARRITPRTCAIIPVHMFGLCADMSAVIKLARSENLAVVEDAACAAGSQYNDRHAGTFGQAGCFSFHGRKIITTGEGGMLLLRNRALRDRAARLRNLGAAAAALDRHRSGAWLLPDYPEPGFNFRMTDLQAAVGLEQMKKLDRIIQLRRRGAKRYEKLLSGDSRITLPQAPENFLHTYQSYVVRLEDSVDRDRVAAAMAARGVDTRQASHAVHSLDYFSKKYKQKKNDFPVSVQLHRSCLTLPLYPQITAREQGIVARALVDAVNGKD